MGDMSLKLSDEVLSSLKPKFEQYVKPDVVERVIEAGEPAWMNEIKKFIDTLVRAVLSEIKEDHVKYEQKMKQCEKCHETGKEVEVPEHRLSVVFEAINAGIFKIKLTVVLKALYHPDCGLCYFRISLNG